MEQFSQFERRIKNALERIALRIESAPSQSDVSPGMNDEFARKIAELTAANEKLQSQLEELSKDAMTIENSKLKASLAQLELARHAETKEIQSLYEKLANALNNQSADIEEDA